MLTSPGTSAVTSPVLLTLAFTAFAELHVTLEDTSCVLPSLKVPIAISCTVVPMAACVLVGSVYVVTTGKLSIKPNSS